jgi:hypothetical protein
MAHAAQYATLLTPYAQLIPFDIITRIIPAAEWAHLTVAWRERITFDAASGFGEWVIVRAQRTLRLLRSLTKAVRRSIRPARTAYE